MVAYSNVEDGMQYGWSLGLGGDFVIEIRERVQKLLLLLKSGTI